MGDVTRLLEAMRAGDQAAANELFPLVYEQLRSLARQHLSRESRRTLDATGLVHEAYLRLVGPSGELAVENRRHFFAAAAQAMRRILVDNARRSKRAKRGGDQLPEPLVDAPDPVTGKDYDLLAIDEALDRLAGEHPEKAELVKLRFFAGLTVSEAAEALEISTSTADRHWAYARAWLMCELNDGLREDRD